MVEQTNCPTKYLENSSPGSQGTSVHLKQPLSKYNPRTTGDVLNEDYSFPICLRENEYGNFALRTRQITTKCQTELWARNSETNHINLTVGLNPLSDVEKTQAITLSHSRARKTDSLHKWIAKRPLQIEFHRLKGHSEGPVPRLAQLCTKSERNGFTVRQNDLHNVPPAQRSHESEQFLRSHIQSRIKTPGSNTMKAHTYSLGFPSEICGARRSQDATSDLESQSSRHYKPVSSCP
jgi:hypothetical protein